LTNALAYFAEAKMKSLVLFDHRMDAYVIGSGEKLEISADIKNEGEDAFNAMLYLQIPRGVNYINANSRFGPLKLTDYLLNSGCLFQNTPFSS
jgi:hypothetical protein